MTPVDLKKTISANKLPPLLFLYGEEAFLLEQSLKHLLNTAVDPATRDFNLMVLSGKDTDPALVMDTARTFPAFAERRVIVIKQAQDLSAAALDALLPYIEEPVAECCLVFCANRIDKRKKFFQSFKKTGELIEFKPLFANKIPAFVRDQARQFGKQFSEDGLSLFCKRVGTNLTEIHGELLKLASYLGDKPVIDVDDVAAVVCDTRVDSIFDLTDVVGARKLPQALMLSERLQLEGEAPLKILAMLTRHFRQLWKTRSLLEQGASQQDVAKTVRINPYFVERIMRQSHQFDMATYPRAFELFLQMDMAMKSSGAHPQALLQKLLTDLVRLG
ncbi:DNA polymerase III subunit delta [uncultured Desulfuromonas sp.]|uniref:DNA polymerase III subunit delta n=1 Tax=uncultured Desulfuromonas sp. TaxID=181013 RepID=UPI002AAAA07C|nr:DNA polymerase III subunit delta [uncultured Desulfuromonas sp.]